MAAVAWTARRTVASRRCSWCRRPRRRGDGRKVARRKGMDLNVMTKNWHQNKEGKARPRGCSASARNRKNRPTMSVVESNHSSRMHVDPGVVLDDTYAQQRKDAGNRHKRRRRRAVCPSKALRRRASLPVGGGRRARRTQRHTRGDAVAGDAGPSAARGEDGVGQMSTGRRRAASFCATRPIAPQTMIKKSWNRPKATLHPRALFGNGARLSAEWPWPRAKTVDGRRKTDERDGSGTCWIPHKLKPTKAGGLPDCYQDMRNWWLRTTTSHINAHVWRCSNGAPACAMIMDGNTRKHIKALKELAGMRL